MTLFLSFMAYSAVVFYLGMRHERAKLSAKIERIAARTQTEVTPEMVEFNAKIAGIMAKDAPTPLISPRKHHHRTQYVRTLEEP